MNPKLAARVAGAWHARRLARLASAASRRAAGLPLEIRPPFVVSMRPMSTPQDSPNRKKQKFRAARKLAEWRKKQEALKAAEPAATPKK
jgi:hypothetical protein